MSLPFISHAQSTDGLKFDGELIEVILKTEALPFSSVQLRCEPDNEEYLIDMQEAGREGRLQLWKASFRKNEDRDVTHYLFKLVQNKQQYWLDARGVQKRMPGREYYFKLNTVNQPPEWVSEQAFYQIFPERFCNGNPDISPKDETIKVGDREYNKVVREWGELPGSYDGSAAREFFGGDLAGIRNKLDYIQDLGVTALYLNPIFTSHSNHKYDTNDYYTVDPNFGTNEEFAELSQELHQRDMKVVLDAVVNHTSVSHEWFDINDTNGHGAYHHPESEHRDFYLFDGDSKDYSGWKGIGTLPVLNFSNQKLKDKIYQAEDSVIRHWLKEPYQIDGWRFDVIHMLGEGEGAINNAHYVSEFRKTVKEENPDAYVLGEHFFEATQWLQGDQEDGAMNYYGFAHPLRALLAECDISYDPISLSISEFADWLVESKSKIPWQNQLTQLNQLDSHDTARFLTLLKGDEEKMRLAASLLFTYVGTPCLYYGTEVGLEGGGDPDCRRCFPWDKVEDNKWLPFYNKLIHLRKTSPELQRGDFLLLDCSDSHMVFARTLDSDKTVIAFSTKDRQIEIPIWKLGLEAGVASSQIDESHYSFDNGALTIKLDPLQAKILKVTN
ncbi:maltodextrin glucosidase [Vibrio sp. HN007]|uniref:maltodextrin glucosidase n=1 Tax=Vibrio iocasae TaxID=3098914 RepID=UPI0035D4CBC8